jgi:hypothetical protein
MANNYEMTGSVVKVGELQTFPSGFTKRELVINDNDPRFPQEIAFSFTKDRAALIENLNPGDLVTVSFDIRGRSYQERHFVDLNGWRCRPADQPAPGASPAQGMPVAGAPGAPAAAPAPAPAAPAPAADPLTDDLPF